MARVMTGLSADVGRAYAQWMAALATAPDLRDEALGGADRRLPRHQRRPAARGGGQPATAQRRRQRAPADRRFGGEEWERRPVFNAVRRAWQATTSTTLSLADGTPGLDNDTARKLRFFTGQFLDAVAPSNFALSNPEVIAATRSSKGRNLLIRACAISGPISTSRTAG
jgi:polyhydroxyalkanoate synthase subunit PhaC